MARRELALSFSGSGLMTFWHFGVASALAEHRIMERVARVHGTSGGAAAAAMLLMAPEKIGETLRVFPRNFLRSPIPLVRDAMEELGMRPRADARFAPHATSLGLRNEILKVETPEDVVTAIAASCCLVPAGVRHRGRLYYDGGLSDPLPVDLSLPTIRVSVFAGGDIAPASRALSLRNAHAILDTALLNKTRAPLRFDEGREAGLRFLDGFSLDD
ncbi:hypothetical protein CTAYLR_005699 [Chrysophaeum taylorii]|uniref:PNPLA domain-containing protein n=1 Tax=Chrysophaeum taylorii TaxID=2483200 RepID=A0AAD7UD04_9STRA|nr:hypothetical protein CTAYLR_005699 [Chrysophaeum taylorii]